jgi:hypothetical protein
MIFSGVRNVSAMMDSINKASRIVPGVAIAIVTKGAHNIKDDAARRIRGLSHAPLYPRSITYDAYPTWSGARAQIGPDKDKRQGSLGNLLEYGSVNNAPHPHLAPALAAEAPRFERAVEDAAVKALGLS